MCKILLPIKPKYVNQILAGSKKYEFRKIEAKRKNIDKLIIYATAPVMKVVAEVEINDILIDKPQSIWKLTKNYAGIEKKDYDKYYENCIKGIAYALGHVHKYETPRNLEDLGINYYPQSLVYLD